MPALSPALPKKTRQPSQHLANGGVVDYIKTKLGFQPQPQQPTSTTSAPVAPPPVSTPPPAPEQNLALLGDGAARRAGGFLANRQRQIDEASGYANGGVIHGKGTGTSDDIKRNMPAGTYIMPADSTRAIGADTLQGLGKNMPVNVSNGEYEMPPEQVHAVGVQALDNIKQSTHTPVRNAKGFSPSSAFFANGGVVDDEKPKTNFSVGGGLDPFAKIDNSQIPKGVAAPEPTAPPPPVEKPAAPVGAPPVSVAPNNESGVMDAVKGATNIALRAKAATAPLAEGSNTRNVLSSVGDDIAAAKGAGQTVGAVLRGTAVIPAVGADMANSVYDTKIKPAMGFISDVYKGATGDFGDAPTNPTSRPASPSSVTAPANTAKAPSEVSNKNNAAPAGAPPSAPANTPATQNTASSDAAKPGDVVKTTDKDGNVSYSGNNIGENFTINGEKPSRGGYMVVPGGGTGGTGAPISGTGFTPSYSRSGGGSAVLIGDSATDERNARLSNGLSPYGGSPNGQLTSNQVRTLAGLKESEDQNETSRYNTAANNDSANYRTELNEQGANARSAIPQAVALEQLNLNKQAAGFTSRAADRQEKAIAAYDAAKTPEEREAAAETIRVLSGQKQTPKDYIMETGGGQRFDQNAGVVLNEPKRLVDVRTNREIGGESQITEKDADALKWLKENPNDPRAAAIKRKLGV